MFIWTIAADQAPNPEALQCLSSSSGHLEGPARASEVQVPWQAAGSDYSLCWRQLTGLVWLFRQFQSLNDFRVSFTDKSPDSPLLKLNVLWKKRRLIEHNFDRRGTVSITVGLSIVFSSCQVNRVYIEVMEKMPVITRDVRGLWSGMVFLEQNHFSRFSLIQLSVYPVWRAGSLACRYRKVAVTVADPGSVMV